MNKGRDLSFFEGKIKVKDLCREQMRILKKFNFKPQKIQQNKHKTTRLALNKRKNQKTVLQIKNEIDEESPKPQQFTPPVPMNYPKELEHLNNKSDSVVKDSKKKCDITCSESPISSIYTDSGQISDLLNILQPKLKMVEYPITSVIEVKQNGKNTLNIHQNPIISHKKVISNKNLKNKIKLYKSKPIVVNYTSSSTSASIPTTLTSSSTTKNYNDNIFPSSDSTPPFTPLPPPSHKQLKILKEKEKEDNQKEKEVNKSERHLTTSIPTSISIPSTLTAGKSSISTTNSSSSTVLTKRKINIPSNSSSTIPSVLGSSVNNVNQKIGVDTPPPAPELLINKDLLLPRRLRQVISPVLEDTESSSENIALSVKHEVKSYLRSSSINNSVSFHPSFLSKTIKPSYSPVFSPNRKRNHKVIIKQSPLSSPYKHVNILPTPDSTSSSSSCSLILESNKIVKNNLKIPSDTASDVLVKDIQYIISSSRKSIESMKEDISLKTIKEENTEDERSSIHMKESCLKMEDLVKKIEFESSESEEEEKEEVIENDEDSDEEEIVGCYTAKVSNQIKSVYPIKEINQSNQTKIEENKMNNEKIVKDDIPFQSLSNLVLPLPSLPIFDETDSQSDETKSTTSSSTMISKLLNYSPKYLTRDEIEDKYNKVCFKYPPLFLDSDFLDL